MIVTLIRFQKALSLGRRLGEDIYPNNVSFPRRSDGNHKSALLGERVG